MVLVTSIGLSCQAQDVEDLSTVPERLYHLLRNAQYADAIGLGQRARVKAEQELPATSHVRLAIIQGLAQAETESGDMVAGAILLEDETKSLESQGLTPPGLADLYQYLANVAGQLGRDAEAEASARRALQLFKSQLMPDDPRIAGALVTLSIQEQVNGSSSEALHSLNEALRIASSSQAPTAPLSLKMTLMELAFFYEKIGNHAKAAGFRTRADAIAANPLDPGLMPDDYVHQSELGFEAMRRQDFADAAIAFERELQIAARRFGEDSQFSQAARLNLAVAYLRLRNHDKAKPLMDKIVESVYADYLGYFSLMNEQERLQFVSSADTRLSLFFSYVHQFQNLDPDLAGQMLDTALWSKGAVLADVQALQNRLRSSTDPDVIRMRDDLDDHRKRYLDAVSAAAPKAYQIRAELQAVESQIVGKLGPPAPSRISWRDLKPKLAGNDAMVEIVRFHFWDQQPSSIVYYSALVLRRAWSTPRYVYLGNDQEIEHEDLRKYSLYATARIDPRPPQLRFWNRLEEAIGPNVNAIYLSTDGALNNVSFDIVPNRDGRLLIDKYDIHILSSTRDLAPSAQVHDMPNMAVLIGNPNFDLLLKDKSEPSGSVPSDSTAKVQRWELLPGTGAQIAEVATTLRRKDWNVSVFTDDHATKQLVSPAVKQVRLLHFATHGYFSREIGTSGPAQSLQTDEAMLKSGLVLAGVNDGGLGRPQALLSSYEISSLDLSGTELVVLSACDTGLADTLVGDEVFGLRRAFQIAGAGSVIMTLWQVPAEQTTPLIESFYELWTGGADKYSALRAAKLRMRSQAPQPVYWGAFVLVEN
jgi:tetratricopeptide (TPR) repeat protein